MAAAAGLGLNATGIDIDDVAISACREQFGKDAAFEFRTVQDHAASGAKADIVYTSEVIEHTIDPNSFTAAMERILKPGGLLFLTTPDAGHCRVPSDFSQWSHTNPPEHLVYFSKKGMRVLLERHGFRDVRFRFKMKPGMSLTARKAA